MSERTIVMDLTPDGLHSTVTIDGTEFSKLLRGVEVRSDVQNGTTVGLIPKRGAAAHLTVLLPEAAISIEDDTAPLSPRDMVAVGDRIVFAFSPELLELFHVGSDGRSGLVVVEDVLTAPDGTKTLLVEPE